jgi:translation elongation factor EF-G
VKNDEETG